VKGSFPALFAGSKPDRELFYSSYLRTYLERDVRDLLKIADEANFVKFMKVAAARTGQLLNYSDLARDVDVSQNTVKAWLSVLQTSGLVYLLQPYFTNVTSRLIKTPKLYFMDTGLCCYLTGWRTAETLESGAMSGAIFETYAITEIIKSYWHQGRQATVYFYRDKEKKEIDLLIEENGTLYPVEIKKSASPGTKDIRNFAVLQKQKAVIGHGAVICLTQRQIPITREVDGVPIGNL
jgi:predicted AAA+ superfamily ATPase